MFQDALLESSPITRKRSRWSMATAFTLELMVAGALVLLPLITTGVIPLSATRLVMPTPPAFTPPPNRPVPTNSGAHGGVTLARQPQIVTLLNHNPQLTNPFFRGITTDSEVPPDLQPTIGGPNNLPDLGIRGTGIAPPPVRRIVISQPSEAMLIKKVIPEYPNIARITGVQGDVKLHAIIAKDGTIQSLTVTGGHPMLIAAAKEAVEHWKYRPYMLNGEPVEVETIITVTFKRY